MRKLLMLLAAIGLLCAGSALAQDDAPSLGDVARQSRQQKVQKDAQSQTKDASAKSAPNKDAQASGSDAKDAPAPKATHVITNEELPHGGLAADSGRSFESTDSSKASDLPPASGDHNAQAEQWRSQILAQKNSIASLQQQIDSVNDSVHYLGGNCVANCVAWNEHQKQKQDEVETMKSQLADQQKHLEEMQDAARKQGFGSSVYEP